MFRDRVDAGSRLAQKLASLDLKDPLVLAIPRGGLVVGAQVAKALRCKLYLVTPRKLGAPANEELAIGAVGPGGNIYVDERLARLTGADDAYLERERNRAVQEMQRRAREYGADPLPGSLEGRTAILVDDGVATGYTMLAAADWTRTLNPARLVVAVPVGPSDTLEKLRKVADEVVALIDTTLFYSVGQYYIDFAQTSDDEVKQILSGLSDNASRTCPH